MTFGNLGHTHLLLLTKFHIVFMALCLIFFFAVHNLVSSQVLQSYCSRGFEPRRCHCVVSLSKNINPSFVLVQHRKTRPFITEIMLIERKESNQTKAIKLLRKRDLVDLI